ncbi:DUF5703 domain-containing protein [soil metagenome]
MLPPLPNPALDANDVVWAVPSVDAAASMPIGNGEVVLNVWVEAGTGDLMVLIGRTDALSEICRILKLGRVRIHLSPSLLGGDFNQHLHLRDGTITVSGSEGEMRLFVDPDANVIHVVGRFAAPRAVRATFETWRNADRALPEAEGGSAWTVSGAPFPKIESADRVEEGKTDLTWFHRNETSVVPKLWEEQSLTGLPGAFDPLLHRTFGGRLTGKGLVSVGDRSLASPKPIGSLDLTIATHTAQGSLDDWRKGLAGQSRRSPQARAEGRNRAWWNGFWDRSWIAVGGESEDATLINRGYALQRYAQAIQSRGEFPIKFNGGYFSVEPTAMDKPFNPDWRQWGDAHWYQNVRFTVAPDLAAGDADLMESFFRLYERARPLAESRTAKYHGAKGAYFPETMTVFGTYAGGDYGWERAGKAPKDVDSPWWRYAWNQGPELVQVMLDRYEATRDERFLKERLLPMAESVLRYFDTRFPKDANGRILIDPAQAVETYWEGVVNDMPTTAGLIAITNRLAILPDLTPEQKAFFDRMKAAAPELPVKDGRLDMAQRYVDKTSNVENPALYAVWPFRLATLAHPDLLKAGREAFAVRKNNLDHGWGYDGEVAALLGLESEAVRILKNQVRNSNPKYRWPATWGPNYDWLPDQNHGGNLMTTAQLMILQAEPLGSGGPIQVLPCWPKEWDIDFRLHAPGNTTIHCVQKGGKIVTLTVEPAARRKDVVLPK